MTELGSYLIIFALLFSPFVIIDYRKKKPEGVSGHTKWLFGFLKGETKSFGETIFVSVIFGAMHWVVLGGIVILGIILGKQLL